MQKQTWEPKSHGLVEKRDQRSLARVWSRRESLSGSGCWSVSRNLDIVTTHDLAPLPSLGPIPCGQSGFLLPGFPAPNSHALVRVKDETRSRGLEEEGLLGFQQNRS